MINWILKKVIGTKYERDIKLLLPRVERINDLEFKISSLSDKELRDKTEEFKKRLSQGETLDDILEEAYAVVREATKRTIKLRHFDVQIIGAIVLHEGKIAEMKTGEGKTLVATMPLYLNALTGKGVHLVTVNDYLAKRDRYWMGPIYEFLGLSVGLLQQGTSLAEKKTAYMADITYGTNNEFGFDYLRDNMVKHKDHKTQRGHYYTIVDEVDSILIDEARTPLIISGPAQESVDLYYKIDKITNFFKKDRDFQVDGKLRSVSLTEQGVAKAEKILKIKNLFSPSNMLLVHHIHQALRAYHLHKRDVDYIVKDGEIVIIDEFTGRLMPSRRYSEGLHQALEAKEGLRIKEESQTLAMITFQNYFRMYKKLAGMTGTADTEAEEFNKIYKLDVVVIPTDKPMIREDFPDVIYKTERTKFKAIVKEIEDLYNKHRPVLVGTTSVEKSELLSILLKKHGIPHQVLNAKHHEREAQIIAHAGQKESVTISTNMAGRGTDIVLGKGVVELSGLHIIGTERHEARRIDNQLRGRSGRQGDPGSSRFYISLEDELMKLFGSERIVPIMERLGIKEEEVIEHPWITKAIERAQKQVEAHNFDIRKRLLEYDDVMNQQRNLVYNERDFILMTPNVLEHLKEIIEEVVITTVEEYIKPKEERELWDINSLKISFIDKFNHAISIPEDIDNIEDLKKELKKQIIENYYRKEEVLGKELMNEFSRQIMLDVLDNLWKDLLYNLDRLKEGIGLRAYGQRDPLVEYKHESFSMFDNFIRSFKDGVVNYIFKLQPTLDVTVARKPILTGIHTQRQGVAKNQAVTRSKEKLSNKDKSGITNEEYVSRKKIGRNEPCFCGSGKKYKYCCGK